MNLTQENKEEFSLIFGYGKIAHIADLAVEYVSIGPVLSIRTRLEETPTEKLQELTGHAGKVLHTSYSRSLLPDDNWLEERVVARLITPAEEEAITAFQAKYAEVQDVEPKVYDASTMAPDTSEGTLQ